MGVNGFTPFLQKTCPAVLKSLPNRFEALRGKKLIIDGTLITQRFHFIQNNHPYRHVLGWYRLARELDENGVSAVVLFDGKERSPAKARETERRREVRRVTFARGAFEQERFQRLNKVKYVVKQFQDLDNAEQQSVMKQLSISSLGAEDGASTLLQEHGLLKDETEPRLIKLDSPSSRLPPQGMPEARLPDAISANDIAFQLKSLFLSYKANLAKLVNLSMTQTPSSPLASEDEHAEKVMTKFQDELSINEAIFWKDYASSIVPPSAKSRQDSPSLATQSRLDSLVEKSQVMAESFQRRNNAPTRLTYDESKEILTAMGILCMDATGAVEAEALASSIVLAGLGDYVASEDTDVLVYEAPMIKNISSRNDELITVCGAEVRASLELSRDAYIDFALLLGTDFSQRIKNVGPQRAYKLIKKLGSIERVVDSIESDPKYELKVPRKTYMAQVDIARLVFQTLPPIPSPGSFISPAKDNVKVEEILRQYKLDGIPHNRDFDPLWYSEAHYDRALAGNYFTDNPEA